MPLAATMFGFGRPFTVGWPGPRLRLAGPHPLGVGAVSPERFSGTSTEYAGRFRFMLRNWFSPSICGRIMAAQLCAPHGQQALFGSRQLTPFRLLDQLAPVVLCEPGGAYAPGGNTPLASW